jgi:hypothetical protein
MNRPDTLFDARIRHALEVRARGGIPEHVDLWPRLRQAAAARDGEVTGERRNLRSGRRIILVVAACMALLMGSVAIAAAASPSLRHLLQQTGIVIAPFQEGESMDAHGRPLAIRPLPRFTLFYPQSQPAGLTFHEIGQLFPPRHGRGYGEWPASCLVPSRCPDVSRAFSAPPHTGRPVGIPSLLAPFWRTSTRLVWFRFSAPDRRFIQIAEWDAAKSPVKSFSRTAVPAPNPRKPDTLLVLAKGGTTIAIETNLGAAEAWRVADSLQSLHLPAR